jgi:hypothetical protein
MFSLRTTTAVVLGAWILARAAMATGSAPVSHPRLRPPHAPSERPLAQGPARFVDAARGDDKNPGDESNPWKSIGHGLRRLAAGETLCLRGGIYHEQVYVSLVGQPDAPITIRSYPNEVAIIDGGFAEFAQHPADAWEPVTDIDGAAPGEYRSTRAYPNIRDVVGAFGDSMIGLQTYWHLADLRSQDERWLGGPSGENLPPVYCGPGIYLDRQTGRIHARLAHTHLEIPGIANYSGETDPRKLPLIIAPFNSVPLVVDQAKHLRLQDLVIRGGGYNTVILRQAEDIAFDNVTIHAGTYGIRTSNVVGLKFLDSAIYGNIPPWCLRSENSLNTHPPRPGTRDVARLTNHALWVFDAPEESSVYYVPFSRDWEIAHSEFTEGCDGLYLDASNIRFHHNLVDNMLDDGLYLSPSLAKGNDDFHIHSNLITRCLMAFAFGTNVLPGQIHIYRNIIDVSHFYRPPRPGNEPAKLSRGQAFGDHGSPPWAPMRIYHNVIIGSGPRWGLGAVRATSPDRLRSVFNNIFVYLDQPPAPPLPPATDAVEIDGNLHWYASNEAAPDPVAAWRASTQFTQSKQRYAPGFEAHGVFADPGFREFSPAQSKPRDLRLSPDSPALGVGVGIPADWQDTCAPATDTRPDIGAFSQQLTDLTVGRGSAVGR